MHLRAGRRSPIWFTNTSTIACSTPRICGYGRQSEAQGLWMPQAQGCRALRAEPSASAGAGWRGMEARGRRLPGSGGAFRG
jgi:hypothetical protein